MTKKTRLKDISKALNLSITTVSRAINNKSDISSQTKQRVLETARLLNYRPNYFAKYLTEDQNNLIGVIVPRVNHSFYSTMINGVLSKAQELGYFIILAESLDDNYNEECILNQFIDLGVEGILISPAFETIFEKAETSENYKNKNIVLIDRYCKNMECPQVTNDHYRAAIHAVEHLYKKGYKKIAHIRGLENDPIAEAIFNGYEKALKKEYQFQSTSYTCDEVSAETGIIATDYLMNLPEKPDAIFVISDEAALGVYKYCNEQHISIPDDLGIIGYSNSNFSQYLSPSLSTIEQHSYNMGVNAIDLLVLEDKSSLRKCIVEHTLLERGSTDKPK